jgi:RimJ/RimL family protein N-acetyltransferase
MLHLETPRLVLRPFEERDLEIFADYRSDPEVARYQGWDAPYSLLNAQVFYAIMQKVTPGTPGEWFQIAIEKKATGLLIGDIGLHILKDNRQAEFGVTFAQENQNQGYASEAVRRVFDYVFNDLQLHRIHSCLDVRNTASARLMERLGMRREAHFIQNEWYKGEWTDEYWYAILRSEWE